MSFASSTYRFMRSIWYSLMLLLVLLCCDGGSYETLQKYYAGYGEQNTQNSLENLEEASEVPKIDMSDDRGRKMEKDNVGSNTIRGTSLSDSHIAQKSRSLSDAFRYISSLSSPNELVRAGTNEKRPPIDVRARDRSKRRITPVYSISSDKYHVNISCHVSFKRSCALPDSAFLFKQMTFNDDAETTASWAGTEDVMELLTFQDVSNLYGITAKAIRKTPRDKHRVINVADDESRCIVKDAVAFESSRVTKIWGEHGRAGPVVAGDGIEHIRNLRKRRSPEWYVPYKQAIFDTGRLISKYAKKNKFGLGRYIEKNDAEDSNNTNVVGLRRKCSQGCEDCRSFPHKGHICHYHYKNHKDRRTHLFRHNKTAKTTKPPHCPVSPKGSTTSAPGNSAAGESVESTIASSNETQADDAEDATQKVENQASELQSPIE